MSVVQVFLFRLPGAEAIDDLLLILFSLAQ